MAIKHIYESAKGTEFLSFDDWLRVTLMENYSKFLDVTFPSEEYDQYYNKWIIEEQITKHTTMDDDAVVSVTYLG
jgi:hypothetical protein